MPEKSLIAHQNYIVILSTKKVVRCWIKFFKETGSLNTSYCGNLVGSMSTVSLLARPNTRRTEPVNIKC